MSIALREFWTRLVRSGITDAPGCKRLATAYSKAHAGTPPSDPASLAQFLIASGQLTSFQADALLADPPRVIRAGNFLIQSASCSPPLSRWVRASRIDDGRTGFLTRATAEQLAGPATERLQAHLSITGPTLQPLQTQRDWTSTLVFSPLPTGVTLYQTAKQRGTLSAKEACEIGLAVAEALEVMHARPLIHGSVRADRIWMATEGNAILLRDPFSPPLGPHDDASPGWLDAMESPASYAAPELASPGQACTEATDLYSLGCLLFRLVSGRNPYDKGSVAETLAAHAVETPPELAEAVARGESGDPMYRVIAYAMAKNRASRFATAGQLAGALRATLPLLPGSPSNRVTSPEQTVAAPSPPPPLPSPPSAKRRQRPTPKSESSPPSSADGRPPQPAQPGTPTPIKAPLSPSPGEGEVSASRPRPPRRRRKKKNNKAPLVLAALCVIVLMLLIGLVVRDPSEPVAEKKKRPPIPEVIPSVTSRVSQRQVAPPAAPPAAGGESVTGYELITDDRLLFVPPYAADASPPPLEMLPPGPGVIVSVRLAAVMEDPVGSALAPELQGLVDSVVSRSKLPARAISRCTAALFPGQRGWPEISLAIELAQPIAADQLLEKWQVEAARTADGATIYAGDAVDSDAYFFPGGTDQLVARFAVGSIKRTGEVAAAEGGAIPLTRTFQTLWGRSSETADLVILVTPNFLFADGRELLMSTAPELVAPLRLLLQPDVSAALVTADLQTNHVYAEVRLAPSGGISEAALMRKVRDWIEAWPLWADRFIVNSVPDPSWRLLAARLPSMMRFVVDQTRFGISEGAVVANAYLPPPAVPQVALATLLAMNTPSDVGAAATSADIPATRPLTVAEMLDRKMTVSFDQESLEFAVDAIALAFEQSLPAGSTMPPVRIIGGDLQLMGITQNQQVRDFAKSDLPLRTVLTDLVVEANPDKSATGPEDPKQALVWVVADDPANPAEKVILVTTRQAAKDKYELPREFAPAG